MVNGNYLLQLNGSCSLLIIIQRERLYMYCTVVCKGFTCKLIEMTEVCKLETVWKLSLFAYRDWK